MIIQIGTEADESRILWKHSKSDEWQRADIDDLIDAYESRPTGEWIWSPKDKDGTVSGCCSNCSFSHLFIGGHTAQYNYCPNCGAKMYKGGDTE